MSSLSPTPKEGSAELNRPVTPRVSVIIPTLNAAMTLAYCLQSIRNQSHKEIEVLVVDGGSCDCTVEIAYKNGVGLIEGRFGRSSARRRGAMEAKGRFILFLDADQRIEPNVVEQCIAICRSGEFVAVKIPERDCGKGIWARCRSLERQIAAADELSYPRFFTRSIYFTLGGHAENLEDYMEDRDLYLRLVDSKYQWGQCKSAIINDIGRLNPMLLGLRGERAARDASAYYERNMKRGENIWVLIKPRFNSLLHNFSFLGRNLLPTMLMPFYITIVYGPRLARASFGLRQATGKKRKRPHCPP